MKKLLLFCCILMAPLIILFITILNTAAFVLNNVFPVKK